MGIIVTSVFILFVLIFLGFYSGKKGLIRQETAPDFSALILRITMPATVFLAIVGQDAAKLTDSLVIMPAIVLYHVLTLLFGILITRGSRIPQKQKGVWIYNSSFSNNGFMGLPLALAIFGNEGLILMALGNAVSNFLMFSVGTKLLTSGTAQDTRIGLRQTVFNNINLAVIAGFAFCLIGIPVPEAFSSLLTYLANITSGLSMIVVGLSMSRYPFRDVFTSRFSYMVSALRLLVIPLLTLLVLKLLPVEIPDMQKSILILTAALPSSAAQTMLAEQYHGDVRLTGRAVFMSTMFSLVTVPLIMMLM
jgi:predicted permease